MSVGVKTIVTVLAAVLVIVLYLSASVSVALTGAGASVPHVTPFTYLLYYGLLGTVLMMLLVTWLSAGGMTKK